MRFGISSDLVGRRARPGLLVGAVPARPGSQQRDPLVSRDRVIKMSPLPVRAGRATPGEDPARAGWVLTVRDHHQLLARANQFLGQPHRGRVRADHDNVLAERMLRGPRLSHG